MTKRPDHLPATPTVQVMERMFNLLEVLASREDSVSLKEISEKTGLHPSTAHRILNRGLPSGTPLEVLSIDEASGFAQVRTENGTEGWITYA